MTKLLRHLTLAALAALASTAAMAGNVTVTFSHPETYADVPQLERERDYLLRETAKQFIKLGKQLPANQDLKVEMLDFDQAGHPVPGDLSYRPLRVMAHGDTTSMLVRYTLAENGQVIQSGVEEIEDMGYVNQIGLSFMRDPMRHEKQMVKEWFRNRLGMR